MIGHDKPRLGRGPAMIAAALLGSVAIGGLGWSLGRASAERAPAAVQQTARKTAETATTPVPARTSTPAPLVKAPPPTPLAGLPPPQPASPDQGVASPTKIDTPADKPDQGAPAAVKPARININTATAAELELLPGIGPGLAQRIIERREKAGKFRTVAELDKVKGIGPRTIDKLRPLVSVE